MLSVYNIQNSSPYSVPYNPTSSHNYNSEMMQQSEPNEYNNNNSRCSNDDMMIMPNNVFSHCDPRRQQHEASVEQMMRRQLQQQRRRQQKQAAQPRQRTSKTSLELLSAIANMTNGQSCPKNGSPRNSFSAGRGNKKVKQAAASESSSSSKWYEHSTSLGYEFTPGHYDVICGRGKQAWNHNGNKCFRALVRNATHAYSTVRTKAERSVIVSEIVDSIRNKGTGFVKQDETTGEWIEVGDLLAREKVGQMLRNALSTKYRSSINSKKKRRRNVQVTRLETLHDVLHANEKLHHSVVAMKEGATTMQSEEELFNLMVQEQSNMLNIFKGNRELVENFLQAEVTACLVLEPAATADDDASSCNNSVVDCDGDVAMV